MKTMILGASGKIGQQVVRLIGNDHTIVAVGKHSGDFQADYTDATAVASIIKSVQPLNHIVVTVGGDSVFKPFTQLDADDFRYGTERKLIAQFQLVMLADKLLVPGGSITLTSGFLSHYPNPSSLATGPLNAAVDTLVHQIAPLLANIRVNVVSPAPIVEAEAAHRLGVLSAKECAQFYIDSINGDASGKIYRAWGGLESERPEK